MHGFHVYDLFIVAFVQLFLSTGLVLSPAREFVLRFRWTGSRITEVLLGACAATAISVVAAVIAAEVWALPAIRVEMAAAVLTIFSVIVVILRPDCNVVGQIFYASYVAAGLSFLAYAGLIADAAARSAVQALTFSVLLLLEVAALLVWNSSVNYVSDVLCRTRHSRPPPQADPSHLPMVSLHIPAYNEPPELLIETIKAVERIDYPDFEVVVIDNNTSDPAVYGPVEEYCRNRERVRFVHVSPLSGYKAGACNLALRSYTDPRAEIIGLIDADDIVEPHYLRETVPYFSDPRLGFIQSFEGNRDFEGSSYYTACVDSYQSFYLAVMSSRNERDSTPFVGTMGLFRRSALEEIGGWNEWCISEDTEASLRVQKAGWSGLYIPRCFGRGVVPPTFAGLNTQRYRWCFGGMQILRLHWRSLMPWDHSPDNHLSSDQRRDYLTSSLSWTRDLIMTAFAFLLLAIAGLRLSGSGAVLMPFSGDKLLLPMTLIVIATIAMAWALRLWTTVSLRRALLAILIGLSASWITALACVHGLSRREGVFRRTSKSGSSHHRLRTALRVSRWETLFAVALYVSAALLAASAHPPILLIFIVSVQGSVFACTPIASLWNLRAQLVSPHEFRRRFDERRARRTPRRRPSFTVTGAAAAVFIAVVLGAASAVLLAPGTLAPSGGREHAGVVAPAPEPNGVVRSPSLPLATATK